MFSLILAIAFAVGGDWREAAVTAGICAVFIGVLVCLERRQKRLRRESTRYYTFPLSRVFDYETVCAAIETAPGVQWTHLCDETARICRIEGAFSWRVALLHQPEFSASACKAQRDRANRAANRAHPEKQEGMSVSPCWNASFSRISYWKLIFVSIPSMITSPRALRILDMAASRSLSYTISFISMES